MIAILDFRMGATPCRAILNDDGEWTCPVQLAADHLNRFHHAGESSPSAGGFGRQEALDAADALDGTLTFPPDEDESEESEEGAVY